MAEGLSYELKDKIDVLSYNPGPVNTNLLTGTLPDSPVDHMAITAE